MKTMIKTFLLVVLFQGFALSAFSANSPYVEAMLKNIQIVYSTNAIDELQQSVNALNRIGDAEKDKWEPYYYAAFGYIMMSNHADRSEIKDQYLDQAMSLMEKAKALSPDESEIIVLEGFIYMMRVTVDPQTRGPQYSPLSMQTFGKAMAMNPNNPRALGLMAQMQFGTAKFFGSSTAEACATADHALEKFESFSADGPLAPRWGKEMTVSLKQQCQ